MPNERKNMQFSFEKLLQLRLYPCRSCLNSFFLPFFCLVSRLFWGCLWVLFYDSAYLVCHSFWFEPAGRGGWGIWIWIWRMGGYLPRNMVTNDDWTLSVGWFCRADTKPPHRSWHLFRGIQFAKAATPPPSVSDVSVDDCWFWSTVYTNMSLVPLLVLKMVMVGLQLQKFCVHLAHLKD